MKKTSPKKTNSLKKRLKRLSQEQAETSKNRIRRKFIDRLPHIRQVRLLVVEWAMIVIAIIMLSITQSFRYTESYATSSWDEGGTYIEGSIGAINSLNPLFANTASEQTLSRLMFSTLTTVDYSGHVGLDLAKSIQSNETGDSWTVWLRDNLKWSDGEPITNADVLYTIKTIKSPDSNNIYASNLSGVEVSEDDSGALIFNLPASYASFASALNIPILPEHILRDVPADLLLENNFSSSPVTSGPFKYNATQSGENADEKTVYLTENTNYYKDLPLLDGFIVHAYSDKGRLLSALNSGEIMGTASLLPTDDGEVTNPQINKKLTSISSGVFAFLNNDSHIFSNKSLRKAIQQGLDMRSLRAPLGDEIGLDYPLLESQISINNYPALPEYDPDAARSTISSWTEKSEIPETVKLVTVNTGYLPALGENLKYQLEQLGFTVNLSVVEPTQDFLITTLRPRDYDILLFEIELGSDPDLFAYYHSSQASGSGLNLSNYKNTLASDLLLAARSTVDQGVRATKYESFLKYWVDDAPAIAIYQVNMAYFVNQNVKSFSEDSRLVTPTDRFTDVLHWSTVKSVKNRTP
ncbi:MAG: ABC transporter substrate-binding protein [Candidatus Saccharibacteria bacterium]|nr:ABC transporter substrate-binding protein [Candidatus Saccharibacteria bacterium]